ncbi:hypothetical protein AB0K09_04240 [Streptomyces sp. NPDC049577]|uniref:hypothetical protein n=1 Tax=Streptomyces sp. NPDC049577 TaxID=3155153 RepID=UPI00343DF68F
MSGIWPPADLPGLHVDLGRWHPRAGTWLVLPTADYRCACGWAESAAGDAVEAFAATVHRTHRSDCPLTKDASMKRPLAAAAATLLLAGTLTACGESSDDGCGTGQAVAAMAAPQRTGGSSHRSGGRTSTSKTKPKSARTKPKPASKSKPTKKPKDHDHDGVCDDD